MVDSKNIVICCDGTMDSFSFGTFNTNVLRFYKMLRLGGPQIAYYQPGLWDTSGSSSDDTWKRLNALGWGKGAVENVADAYQFLMRNFNPGDNVFIFGVSRGAYVARALCGLLHMSGLLSIGNERMIPTTIRMVTQEEVDFKVAADFKKTFSRQCNPKFLGIWDTVSSIGWFQNPVRFAFTTASRNPDITIVRHAVSIDERRAFFRKNLVGKASNSQQDVKEVWFSGVHSDVGGGYPEEESQLSKIALEWMVSEAQLAGLIIDEQNKADILGANPPNVAPDPITGRQHESLRGFWWVAELWPKVNKRVTSEGLGGKTLRVNLGRRRYIAPGSMIHKSVVQRMNASIGYKPSNLPEQYIVVETVAISDSERHQYISEPFDKQQPRELFNVSQAPPELVNAIRNGDCVLYLGAGLAAEAGFPTWRALLSSMLDLAANRQGESDTVQSLRLALARGDSNSVADAIWSSLLPSSDIISHLNNVFKAEARVPPTLDSLSKLSFAGVVTSNFDILADQAFRHRGVTVLTAKFDSETIQNYIARRQFFVLKLFGDLARSETILLSPYDYNDMVAKNISLAQCLEGLFVSRTLLFLGTSLDGLEDFLRSVLTRGTGGSSAPRRHFAFVAVDDLYSRARVDQLLRRYNVEVLPFTPSHDFHEVSDFVGQLAAAAPQVEPAASVLFPSAPSIKRVLLTNIGPFDEAEFLLDANWNVFLGDNGVGKSTVLRAMAAAIAGKDAESFSERLIKSSRNDATITLETERGHYVTKLLRKTGGGAELSSSPMRPLEPEGWLVLGFPPLRMMSQQTVGDIRYSGTKIGTTSDLIPLVAGDPDPRMSSLKKWIISVHHEAIDRKGTAEGERYKRLLNKFFEVIGTLTPGVEIELEDVIAIEQKVLVKTDDGVVPIETVSQGTISLMSWVGVLLQRLFEIYGETLEVDASHQFAIVLIDEIDAHMHPAWQQQIIEQLSEIFPTVQFIATTHSPLIAAGMKVSQIIRLTRNEDREVTQLKVSEDAAQGRADQILTSELFGLATTLDKTTQQFVDEYKELLGKSRRTPEEENRYQELAQTLRFRIPPPGETPARRAQELVRLILLEQAGAQPEQGGSKRLLEKAEQLITAVERQAEKTQDFRISSK